MDRWVWLDLAIWSMFFVLCVIVGALIWDIPGIFVGMLAYATAFAVYIRRTT